MSRAIKMWSNRELNKCFSGWLANVQLAKRNRSLLDRAARKMKNRTLLAMFNAWDAFVAYRIRGRYLIRKTLGRLAYGKQASGWQTWQKAMARLKWEQELSSLSDDDQKRLREQSD